MWTKDFAFTWIKLYVAGEKDYKVIMHNIIIALTIIFAICEAFYKEFSWHGILKKFTTF
jgi:hypothetical protein